LTEELLYPIMAYMSVILPRYDRVMSQTEEITVATQKRTYARYTSESIALLGKLIRHGRKQRKMTEQELADRLGIARSTLQRAESGDPKVEIGIMFEAASLVGVKLFDSDKKGVRSLSARVDDRLAVLPKHIYKSGKKVIDEF